MKNIQHNIKWQVTNIYFIIWYTVIKKTIILNWNIYFFYFHSIELGI